MQLLYKFRVVIYSTSISHCFKDVLKLCYATVRLYSNCDTFLKMEVKKIMEIFGRHALLKNQVACF